jgi:hypothetical protein
MRSVTRGGGDYLTIGERPVVRCGGLAQGLWFGRFWDGTYAYTKEVTLYIINGVGSIDDAPSNLRSLQTILGELP